MLIIYGCYQLPKTAFRLFRLPWDTVLVVYVDGTYSWGSNNNDVKGVAVDGGNVLWCDVVKSGNDIAELLMIFKNVSKEDIF